MRNLSWLFYKQYFKDLRFNNSKDDKNKIKDWNTKLIEARFIFIENPIAKQRFEMLIQYPGLATGVGISHEAGIEGEFKLGVHFDYTYGMPVIYGSSVKGVLRSAFPDAKIKERNNESNKEKERRIRENKIRACKCQLIIDYLTGKYDKKLLEEKKKELKKKYATVDIDKLRDWIFEGIEKVEIATDKDGKEKKKTYYLSIYNRDIFFDAVIKKPYCKQIGDKGRILESDSITPHVKQGMSYEKSMLKNPIPITFLKIASGVTMEFRFDLKGCTIGGIEVSADDKKRLFKQILLDFGAGAKTNVGYGQFSAIE
jgi:CRISPR-associated protein Cmr6